MYCLRAVIATEHVLSELAGAIEDGHDAHVAFLGQHLSLLAMTDVLFDAVTVAGASLPDGLWKVPAALGRMLAACSANGPVAYVEAEFFGGTGEQAAQVWDRGGWSSARSTWARTSRSLPQAPPSPKHSGDSG